MDPAVTPSFCYSYPHPYWVEIQQYLHELGRPFHHEWCNSFDGKVLQAYKDAPDSSLFYKTTDIYLYQNTGFFLDGYKRPYYAILFRLLGEHPGTILDYGCGAGHDGIWFLQNGLPVTFAELPCVSSDFLQWRLKQYGLAAAVILLPAFCIPQHDIVWCIDVLEHFPPAMHHDFLLQLELLGKTVVVSLVGDVYADSTVHYPVDIDALTSYVSGRRRVWWKDYHEQPSGSKVRLLVIGERVPLLQTV